jgi:Holliday junction resolvasome RuvABC endonuclease subunit
MCRVAFIQHDIDVFTVNVKTWKRDVVGNGNADKAKITVMARKIFGPEVDNLSQDAVDALMIAKWGELRIDLHA